MSDPVNESKLVESVLAGEGEAFGPLVTPYRNSLLAVAFRLTGNEEDAREVVQEALLRAFRYLHHFDRSRSFRNWLLGIAANEARTRLRLKLKDRELVAGLKREAAGKEPASGDRPGNGFRSELMKCLSALTDKEREIFVLRDLEGLSVKETAEALRRSDIAVRVGLCEARKKLRLAMAMPECGTGKTTEVKR